MPRVAIKKTNSAGTTTKCCNDDCKEIEKLAYQFFLERGGKHGYHQEDWARAEAIVKGKKK